MNKVLLIQPTLYDGVEDAVIAAYCPPLGLGYLASSLKAVGCHVKVFDMLGREAELASIVSEFSPDLIGLSCMTTAYPTFARTVKALRQEVKYEGPLIAGGPHAMLEPEKTLAQLPLDACVVTEGEQVLQAVVQHGLSGSVPGLCLPAGLTEPAPLIADLDSLPFPAHEEFEHDEYSEEYYPLMPIRGCPFQCVFCSSKWLWGNSVRHRSPENVVEEMRHLRDEYGYRRFFMYAETFVVNKRWLREFAERSKELNVTFRCHGRVNLMTDEVLGWLQEAGCEQVDYGMETGVQRIADNIGKSQRVEDIADVARKTIHHGMHAHLYCMLSLPGETLEEMRATLRLAEQLRKQHGCSHTFQVTRVYPGTPLSRTMEFEHDDWTEVAEADLPYRNVPMYLEAQNDREAVLKLWRRGGGGWEVHTRSWAERLGEACSRARVRLGLRTRVRSAARRVRRRATPPEA